MDEIYLRNKEAFDNLGNLKFKAKYFKHHGNKNSSPQWVHGWCSVNASQYPGLVIDAGCRSDQFKKYFKGYIGIDCSPHSSADIVTTILDAKFEKESAELVLALGVMQYVSEEYCIDNFNKAASWVSKNGKMIFRVRGKESAEHVTGTRTILASNVKNIYFSDEMVEHVMKKNNLKIDVYKEFMHGKRKMIRDRLWVFQKC